MAIDDKLYQERMVKALEKIAKKICEDTLEPSGSRRIDLLRAMPDEKFADVISRQVQCDTCPIMKSYCMLGDSCRNSWLKFLLDKPGQTTLDELSGIKKEEKE